MKKDKKKLYSYIGIGIIVVALCYFYLEKKRKEHNELAEENAIKPTNGIQHDCSSCSTCVEVPLGKGRKGMSCSNCEYCLNLIDKTEYGQTLIITAGVATSIIVIIIGLSYMDLTD